MTQERRGFVKWLLGGGVAASLGSFLYPVIRFVNPPAVTEAAVEEVAAGKAAAFKPNSGKIIRFGSRPVLLIRMNETEWRALSAVCTHLNCTVQYKADARVIWCACHNGMYDLNGAVISGPPPKPLEEYVVHLRGDDVFVSRRA
jgi:cytochrome b6-f complex iron-sulfur subunit